MSGGRRMPPPSARPGECSPGSHSQETRLRAARAGCSDPSSVWGSICSFDTEALCYIFTLPASLKLCSYPSAILERFKSVQVLFFIKCQLCWWGGAASPLPRVLSRPCESRCRGAPLSIKAGRGSGLICAPCPHLWAPLRCSGLQFSSGGRTGVLFRDVSPAETQQRLCSGLGWSGLCRAGREHSADVSKLAEAGWSSPISREECKEPR